MIQLNEMKHYILALALSVLSLFNDSIALGQTALDDLRTSNQIITWTDADVPNYSIQILAAKTPPSDASFVKSDDVVYEYQTTDDYVHYYIGKYDTYAAANKDLKEVRSKGYDGAFISNIKKLSSTKSSAKQTGIFTAGHKPIEIDPDKDYVIQLGAYRYPLYISYFENVGDVYEYRLNDKIFRYTTKPCKGTQVEAELQRVRSLGHNNAFVVEYSTYAPYRIE